MNTKSSERAVESAVLQIRQWILDGQFATGEKIPKFQPLSALACLGRLFVQPCNT